MLEFAEIFKFDPLDGFGAQMGLTDELNHRLLRVSFVFIQMFVSTHLLVIFYVVRSDINNHFWLGVPVSPQETFICTLTLT